MTVRAELHELLDALPEAELSTARRYLESLRRMGDDPLGRFLREAPEDDEPTTPDEDEGAAEAREELRRGEGISVDEIKRTLLA